MASPNAYHSLVFGRATDVGRVRTENQDSFGKFPVNNLALDSAREQLFIVADGMGGHADGRKASNTAVEKIAETFYQTTDQSIVTRLRLALEEANRVIHAMVRDLPQGETMGTTCTVLVLTGARAFVGHIGDSRMYRYNGFESEQVTRDHTMVSEMVEQGVLTPEEAVNHPHRNMLSRALGPEQKIRPDSFEIDRLRINDTFVLCSDGLSEVSQEEIADVIRDLTPQNAADALVRMANQRGGLDNVTVQVVAVEPPGVTASATVSGDQTVAQDAYTGRSAPRTTAPPTFSDRASPAPTFKKLETFASSNEPPEPKPPPPRRPPDFGYGPDVGTDDDEPDPFTLQESAGLQAAEDEEPLEKDEKKKKKRWWTPFSIVLGVVAVVAFAWFYPWQSDQQTPVRDEQDAFTFTDSPPTFPGEMAVSIDDSVEQAETMQDSAASDVPTEVEEPEMGREDVESSAEPVVRNQTNPTSVPEPTNVAAETPQPQPEIVQPPVVEDPVSEVAPDPVQDNLNTGNDHLNNGRYDQALAAFNNVLAIEPTNGRAKSGKQKIYRHYLQRGDALRQTPQEALIQYEKAQKVMNSPEIRNRIVGIKRLL